MNVLSWLLILPIRLYQLLLSPLLGRNCRFEPTCSNYMKQAIIVWGPFKGLYLGLKRISRCHPWGDSGEDPVPAKPKNKQDPK